jgi:hypothetical protein
MIDLLTWRRAGTLLLALLPQLVSEARAQIFKVQGGSSTLMNADGAQVDFKSPQYEGSIGGGFVDGKFGMGVVTRYRYRGYLVTAGDDLVAFQLPTDLFDSSHYFSARGLGISHTDDQESFYALAGETSTWFGSGFFQAAQSERPVAILFFQRRITKELRVVSRNILSNRQTSLQAVEWQPWKWLKTSATGGAGSNQKYFGAGFCAETDRLMLKGNYINAGSMFRRVTVVSPLGSEVNKANAELLYRPNAFFNITLGHQNILEPLTAPGPVAQASVNEVTSEFHFSRLYLGGGLFGSTVSSRTATGANFYVGRRFGDKLEINGNYFESHSRHEPTTAMLSGTVRENLTQRFSLLQLVTHSDGQTTAAFGGDFISNRLYLRADYQNVYLPFRPNKPFQQALALNAGLRIAGPLQLTAASSVGPDGHLRYSFGASTFVYHERGMLSLQSRSQDTFSMPKFVVQGIVKDDQGQPLEGAALHIGREVAYSDSRGHFAVRFRKHGPFSLQVEPNEFLSPGFFEILKAPPTAKAETDDAAQEIEIVVRRVKRRQAIVAEGKREL